VRAALAALALLCGGCATTLSNSERAIVSVGELRCVEPWGPVESLRSFALGFDAQAKSAPTDPSKPLVDGSAGLSATSAEAAVRVYTLSQVLLFLQTGLFNLCQASANGTISEKGYLSGFRLLVRSAGELLWLEGGGPFEDEPEDEE